MLDYQDFVLIPLVKVKCKAEVNEKLTADYASTKVKDSELSMVIRVNQDLSFSGGKLYGEIKQILIKMIFMAEAWLKVHNSNKQTERALNWYPQNKNNK